MKPKDPDHAGHAEELIRYFRRMSGEEPTDPHYPRAVALAERWLGLIREDSSSEPEIRALVAELDFGMKSSGSGWHDLRISVSAWARSRGFDF